MSEKRFCAYCGHKINTGAKFCGGCGKSLEVKKEENQSVASDTSSKKEPVENKTNDTKDKINDSMNQAKEGAQRVAGELKEKITSDEVKSKVDKTFNQMKNLSDKTKKIILVIALVLVAFGGWNWVSNKDFRHEMKNGETCFNRGEYGEAVDYYKKAQDMKPGNKEALEMYDYATDLSNLWIRINSGFSDSDGTVNSAKGPVDTREEVLEKEKQVSKKNVKDAYSNAVKAIEGTVGYEIDERISKKYKE